MECITTPCICVLTTLEKRLELLRLEEEIRDLQRKKEAADEKVAENVKARNVDKTKNPENDKNPDFETEPDKPNPSRGELSASPPTPTRQTPTHHPIHQL